MEFVIGSYCSLGTCSAPLTPGSTDRRLTKLASLHSLHFGLLVTSSFEGWCCPWNSAEVPFFPRIIAVAVCFWSTAHCRSEPLLCYQGEPEQGVHLGAGSREEERGSRKGSQGRRTSLSKGALSRSQLWQGLAEGGDWLPLGLLTMKRHGRNLNEYC